MEEKDLKQIKELFQESFTKIWKDNLEPALDELNNEIALRPTKSYMDDKFANLEGGLIVKLRKEDQKVNRLAEMLKQKQILDDRDIGELANWEIFPK